MVTLAGRKHIGAWKRRVPGFDEKGLFSTAIESWVGE